MARVWHRTADRRTRLLSLLLLSLLPCGAPAGTRIKRSKLSIFVAGTSSKEALTQVRRTFRLGQLHFVQAYRKQHVNLSAMADIGLLHRDARAADDAVRMSSFGPAAFPAQGRFTVACMLTHRRLWELQRERGLPVALMLEDDSKFVPGQGKALFALDAVQTALRWLENFDPAWDVFNLGRCGSPVAVLCEAMPEIGPLQS